MALYEIPHLDVLPERALSGKDDILTQILSPVKTLPCTATPKPQQPRLSQAGDSQEHTFVPISINSVEPTTPTNATETDRILDAINTAFDQFDLQLQSLHAMLGESTSKECCN